MCAGSHLHQLRKCQEQGDRCIFILVYDSSLARLPPGGAIPTGYFPRAPTLMADNQQQMSAARTPAPQGPG